MAAGLPQLPLIGHSSYIARARIRTGAALAACGESCRHCGQRNSSLTDPNVWYGRALQEIFVDLLALGLASMYPASDWSVCSGPPWISARLRSHYLPGLKRAIWVTRVRMRREDRPPFRLNLLADLGGKTGCDVMSSLAPYRCSSSVRARRPFLRPGLQLISGAARRGRQARPSR